MEKITAAGAYNVQSCTIHIADGYEEGIFNLPSRQRIKETLRNQAYGDFLSVAVLSHQAVHFVQHARGQLPYFLSNNFPCNPSPNRNMEIVSFHERFSPRKLELYTQTLSQTFSVMHYRGNPPRQLIVHEGTYEFEIDADPERRRYHNRDRYIGYYLGNKYPFEKEAERVKNKVLIWFIKRIADSYAEKMKS